MSKPDLVCSESPCHTGSRIYRFPGSGSSPSGVTVQSITSCKEELVGTQQTHPSTSIQRLLLMPSQPCALLEQPGSSSPKAWVWVNLCSYFSTPEINLLQSISSIEIQETALKKKCNFHRRFIAKPGPDVLLSRC